mmetsp:Transcript_3964/g.9352  ORF Transcript_3964/g.9352 Transcript_3964/m.9352 type:complete len:210 (-) Transcript_3964:331-960(-)
MFATKSRAPLAPVNPWILHFMDAAKFFDSEMEGQTWIPTPSTACQAGTTSLIALAYFSWSSEKDNRLPPLTASSTGCSTCWMLPSRSLSCVPCSAYPFIFEIKPSKSMPCKRSVKSSSRLSPSNLRPSAEPESLDTAEKITSLTLPSTSRMLATADDSVLSTSEVPRTCVTVCSSACMFDGLVRISMRPVLPLANSGCNGENDEKIFVS